MRAMDLSFIADAMHQAVPWVRTVGVKFTEVEANRVVAELPDSADTHNHVGGPHAAMIFGLAETASGAVAMASFAQELGRATLLVSRSEITYRKVALGDLSATAVLGRPAAEVIAELDAGTRPEFPVNVTVSNADGVVTAEMVVVWTLRPNKN